MRQNLPGPVRFHFLTPQFYFPHRTKLKRFITRLFQMEGKKLQQLDYIFCSDEYLFQINRQFLKHSTFTDIITFPFSQPGQAILGEVYISVQRVEDNSLIYNSSFTHELHRVIFHGALHLCGYKDKTQPQVKKMRLKEAEYLHRYFVPRGTEKL